MFTLNISIPQILNRVKVAEQVAEPQPVAVAEFNWYGYTWRSYYTGEWVVLEFLQANERGGVQCKFLLGNGTIRERWVAQDELQWERLTADQIASLREIGAL